MTLYQNKETGEIFRLIKKIQPEESWDGAVFSEEVFVLSDVRHETWKNTEELKKQFKEYELSH